MVGKVTAGHESLHKIHVGARTGVGHYADGQSALLDCQRLVGAVAIGYALTPRRIRSVSSCLSLMSQVVCRAIRGCVRSL